MHQEASSNPVAAALRALVPRYLVGRDADLAGLRGALAAADFPTIQRIGHDLKGTGQPYGFPRITELGRSLEQAAKDGNLAAACESVALLATYLDSLANR